MSVAPGQTVGPFFHLGLALDRGSELVPPGTPGAIRLHGRVLDGDGAPVPDAMIEIGQAGPDGRPVQRPGSLRRDGWTFTGWGRAATDDTGHYAFSTLTPGAADGHAAFFAVTLFARGLTDRLLTRAYPPQDEALLAADPLLAALPPARRQTLLAVRDEHGYVFDLTLQGEHETVFLAHRTR